MTYKSLRDWVAKLDEVGELKRISAEVDWNLELSAIARQAASQGQPALLFENIKDYQHTPCRKLFINDMGSHERVAMALGLTKETNYRRITEFLKERIEQRVDPVKVVSGPVKQNIMMGDKVDLLKFPVPRYNELDGGRYINTRGCIVTMDPDTKIMNVGMYRGMIGDNEKSIPSLLVLSQHWGIHYSKYKKRGEDMPVAVVYGGDPVLQICSATPIQHPGCSEYEVVGAIRGEPVELVKCETSDLYVPVSAEIIVEGRISSDPKNFQLEGPFGEYTGFYGGTRQPKPTIRVECITYRDDPIFQGGLCGSSPGKLVDLNYWVTPAKMAIIWKALESVGVPNILGVWTSLLSSGTNLRVQIDKNYRGHAQQVAAALWGISNLSMYSAKNLIVVDKDIDVFDDQAVEWALAYRTNAGMGDIQFFSGTAGSTLDPSVPLSQRDVMRFGAGKWNRMLIDATVNWELEPEEQYGGKLEPPLCTEIPVRTTELINRRWHEYGF